MPIRFGVLKVLQHQFWHLFALIILLVGLYYSLEIDQDLLLGEFAGISTTVWFLFAVLVPILHQIYVLVFWRLELHFKTVTKNLGRRAFRLYKTGFTILILARPVSLIGLALANAWTLNFPSTLSYILSIILLLPGIYLAYSIRKYFGIDRAFGIDHFEPEKYRDAPMVRQGIFRYSDNAMYVFGFMALWVPGILLQSKAALLLALFNHLYIWIHYYFTELPDMKIIYQNDGPLDQ